MDLSRRSVLAPRPHERERQSLEQLALIRQLLAARGLSLTDAMFLATQLVHHGFFEAEAVLSTLLIPQPRMFSNIYDEIDISMRVNTRDVIAASRVAPGAFRLFYGLDHPIDRAHAEQLADLSQVQLVGLNDCSHYATPTLMERGEFVAAFADALAAVPISAEARND